MAPASELIFLDSWEYCFASRSAVQKGGSSVLSDDKSAFKGPPSARRTTLWEIACTKQKGGLSGKIPLWGNFAV